MLMVRELCGHAWVDVSNGLCRSNLTRSGIAFNGPKHGTTRLTARPASHGRAGPDSHARRHDKTQPVSQHDITANYKNKFFHFFSVSIKNTLFYFFHYFIINKNYKGFKSNLVEKL